ncbi:MAG: GSU2403 family nucleotidyltransferase fold protein [Rhodoferax sp.]|nr:GSU2403 family nucleotidyltransferase fold protein [Rhodoferax sp.]
MAYKKHDFLAFSADSQRVAANLEQSYATWLDLKRLLNGLASSMFWTEKEGVDYLNVKKTASDNGTTVGRRDASTEAQFNTYTEAKAQLKVRIRLTDAQLRERSSLYRRLRLPAIPDRQAEILRCLDIEGMLGTDLMVVGTNAFVAYELACGARFPTGNEETEDFDMAWCRGTKVSLAQSAPAKSATRAGDKSLFGVLKSLDSSYQINKRKPYQAVNNTGYEVELLAAPSTHPLPKSEPFEPMQTLVEQEWLLKGTPLSGVVATVRGRACPLYVPDPRWMALHKLWLSEKAERNSAKRPKDRRQGEVLLDATRYFLRDSHPLNIDFVMALPDDLLPHFNFWCESRGFVPPLDE